MIEANVRSPRANPLEHREYSIIWNFRLWKIVNLQADRIGTSEFCRVDDAGNAAVIESFWSLDEDRTFDAVAHRAIWIIGEGFGHIAVSDSLVKDALEAGDERLRFS